MTEKLALCYTLNVVGYRPAALAATDPTFKSSEISNCWQVVHPRIQKHNPPGTTLPACWPLDVACIGNHFAGALMVERCNIRLKMIQGPELVRKYELQRGRLLQEGCART